MMMNPLNLLTKGRTILGLKERPGAYKLLEKGVVPNFSGPKRAATSQPEPDNAQTALFEEDGRREKEEGKRTKEEEQSVPPPAICAVPPERAAATLAPQPQNQRAKLPLWSWRAGIFAGWARSWRKAPPFQSPAVQTELVLDRVKVMRNDLKEDDLEAVPVEKKAGRKTEKPAPSEKAEREKLAANP
jgi:hypothetical protein